MVRARSFSGLSVNPKSIGPPRRLRDCPEQYIRAGPRRRASADCHERCGSAPRASAAPMYLLPPIDASGTDEVLVGIGASVAVELPELAHLRDLVHVEVPDEELFLVRVAHIAHELAAGIHEVGLPVEVVLTERLDPDPIDR